MHIESFSDISLLKLGLHKMYIFSPHTEQSRVIKDYNIVLEHHDQDNYI